MHLLARNYRRLKLLALGFTIRRDSWLLKKAIYHMSLPFRKKKLISQYVGCFINIWNFEFLKKVLAGKGLVQSNKITGIINFLTEGTLSF